MNSWIKEQRQIINKKKEKEIIYYLTPILSDQIVEKMKIWLDDVISNGMMIEYIQKIIQFNEKKFGFTKANNYLQHLDNNNNNNNNKNKNDKDKDLNNYISMKSNITNKINA